MAGVLDQVIRDAVADVERSRAKANGEIPHKSDTKIIAAMAAAKKSAILESWRAAIKAAGLPLKIMKRATL